VRGDSLPRVKTRWIVIAGIAVLTAAAGAAHYADAPALLAFVVATAALAGLAWVVSFATEQVGTRFGPAVTGVLQSTLGNLPEFFIVIFALSAGEVVVAQTSIIGSIFANALFVLGLAIVAGSRQSSDGIMRFSVRLPKDTATLMLLASFLIVLVGIAVQTHDPAAAHVKAISIAGAVALLITYVAWLVDYLRSDTAVEPSHGAPLVSMGIAVALLSVAGVGAALVSDWFVSALTPAMEQVGISKAFAGLVIVAIAGNAVENTAGVALAIKGQSDLSISVIKNSVAQITAFLFPALVLVSLLFATPLTFAIAPVYVGALALTALALWQITNDGEATLFEGVALISLYAILAVVAWYE
jgi:Ca2+:H+ antiporter